MEATLLHPCHDQTGEAATWIPGLNVFLWVDIDNGILHKYDAETGVVTDRIFPDFISAIIPKAGNSQEIIIALKNRLISYHLSRDTYDTLVDIPSLSPHFRTNDCKASPEGRLWIGIMHTSNHDKTGSLFCLHNDLSFNRALTGQCIPNGITWNQAGDRMYYADSGRRCIEEYAYDRLTGSVRFIRTAVQVPEKYGVPDGMTIDSNGYLWVAHWGGYGVYIWNPANGQLIDKIDVPVPNVASCTFGGTDRPGLFITTACSGLTASEKEMYPLSGSLFFVQVPATPGENHYPFTNG